MFRQQRDGDEANAGALARATTQLVTEMVLLMDRMPADGRLSPEARRAVDEALEAMRALEARAAGAERGDDLARALRRVQDAAARLSECGPKVPYVRPTPLDD